MTDESTWPRNDQGPLLLDESLAGEVEAADAPTDAQAARVRDLALAQLELIKLANGHLQAYEETVAKLRVNREEALSGVMDQLGVTTIGLRGGHSVEVKDEVGASLPVKEAKAYAAGVRWLDEHHPDLLKRTITISFGREDEAWAAKFKRDMAQRKRPLNAVERVWVEPQTLSAFAREQHELARQRGVDPETMAPSATLGIFKRRVADVKGPAVPKLRKPR